jgi:hypothetical protein
LWLTVAAEVVAEDITIITVAVAAEMVASTDLPMELMEQTTQVVVVVAVVRLAVLVDLVDQD